MLLRLRGGGIEEGDLMGFDEEENLEEECEEFPMGDWFEDDVGNSPPLSCPPLYSSPSLCLTWSASSSCRLQDPHGGGVAGTPPGVWGGGAGAAPPPATW